MGKTIVIYGSSTGTCEELAGKVGEKLGVEGGNIYKITYNNSSVIKGANNHNLGNSTREAGDHQKD